MLSFTYSGYPCQLINYEFILTISSRGYIRIEVIKPKNRELLKKILNNWRISFELENFRKSYAEIIIGDIIFFATVSPYFIIGIKCGVAIKTKAFSPTLMVFMRD